MAAPVILGVKAWANYTSAGSGASTTVTNTGTTVSGRGLLALIGGQATNNTPSFSDSKGNTWTKIASLQNGTDAAAMYLCGNPTNVGTSHSFTVNWTDGYSSVAVLELDQAVALDNSSTATDSGTPWDSTLTTLSADCLVVTSTTVYATTGSWALAASGWTWYGQLPVPADATDWDIGLLYKTSATATANAISMTGTDVDGSIAHHLVMASLKAAGGGSDTSISPAQGALTITGHAPTLARTANQSVSPAADAVAITGLAPTLAQTANQAVSPGPNSVVITGLAPTLQQTNGFTVVPAADVVVLSGFAPTLAQTANQSVSPGADAVVVAGFAPSIVQASASITVTPYPVLLAVAGYAPALLQTGRDPYPLGSGGGPLEDFPSQAEIRERVRAERRAAWAEEERRITQRLNRKPKKSRMEDSDWTPNFARLIAEPKPTLQDRTKAYVRRRIEKAAKADQTAAELRQLRDRLVAEDAQKRAKEDAERIEREKRAQEEAAERTRQIHRRNHQAIMQAIAWFDL